MFWLAKGANLALAEPFVARCAESVSQLFTSHDDDWHLVYARRLLQNSAKPLQFHEASDLSSIAAQFLDHNARWETLGIFFAAVSRATIDIPFFPTLYTTGEDQYTLRRLATKLSDFALEISLSLDCLNDLQLIVQYENFIVHSYVDGDQSESYFCSSARTTTDQPRLPLLAQTRRRHLLNLCTRLPREPRDKARDPTVSHGTAQNRLRQDLLRRQEHRHFPRPAAANEQAVLPLPDPVLSDGRETRWQR